MRRSRHQRSIRSRCANAAAGTTPSQGISLVCSAPSSELCNPLERGHQEAQGNARQLDRGPHERCYWSSGGGCGGVEEVEVQVESEVER
mmetsp:Transcript_36064/g.89762  ORF Transcript_36064/g.89762 Transcript_36064/m.89762 type:complete len:89 (-) Transcript_36064:410-676(-)